MASTAQKQENPVLAEFDRLGFTYTLDPQYDLGRLSPKRRVQVRDANHYAPAAEVKNFAVQMAYSQFPPIVVTEDEWLVDGNTRVGGSRKRGQKFFPAYVLDVNYKSGSEKQRHECHALALALNQMNGRRLTTPEQRAEARRLIDLGWKAEAIEQSAGIPSSAIRAVRKEREAEKKMARVGIGTNGEVKSTIKRALAHRDAQSLNDQPFRELVSLATDADLKASEIVDLAKQVKESGSDEAGTEVLTNLRTEFAERIRQKELTGTGKPPASRKLRQALGGIVKFSGQETSLIETNPNMVTVHLASITEAIEVLNTVLEEQERRAK